MPTYYDNRPVLLVEDESFWHAIVTTALSDFDIAFDWARSADECMDFLNKQRYNVVILDLELSRENKEKQGLHLVNYLTGTYFPEKELRTAVLILSRFSDPKIELKTYRGGSINFQEKPTTQEELNKFNSLFPSKIDALIYFIESQQEEPKSELQCGNILITLDEKLDRKVSVDSVEIPMRNREQALLSLLMSRNVPISADLLCEELEIKSVKSLTETLRTLKRWLIEYRADMEVVSDFRGYFLTVVAKKDKSEP